MITHNIRKKNVWLRKKKKLVETWVVINNLSLGWNHFEYKQGAHATYKGVTRNALKSNDTEWLQKAMKKMKCLEPYYSRHQLQKYDKLKMHFMIL